MEPFIVLTIAVFVGFFVSSTVGFGASLIALPIMLLVVDLPYAVALISVFFFLFSGAVIPANWNAIRGRPLLEIAPWAVIGLGIGVYLLEYTNPLYLKKLLGVFTILYVLYSFMMNKRIKFFKKIPYVFGLVGGVSSGLFSSGGPLYVTYILNRLRNHKAIRATIMGMGFTDILRVPLLTFTGTMTTDVVITSFYIFPVFLLAIFIGHWLHDRVPEELSKRAVLLILFGTGVSLLF